MSNKGSMYQALQDKAGFSVAEESENNGQIRILARVADGSFPNWKIVMQRLKLLEKKCSWTLDLSKMYFLLGGDDNAILVFGWRVIIKTEKLDEAYAQIESVVRQAPNARFVVDEVRLPGHQSGQRNAQYARGKGARLTSGSKESTPAVEHFKFRGVQ